MEVVPGIRPEDLELADNGDDNRNLTTKLVEHLGSDTLVHAIKAAGGTTLSSFHKEVSADSIKLAHELGLSVNVWTVNKPGRMRDLIEMGVDGIITDYPDQLRRVLEELNLPVPAPTPVEY